MGGTLVFDGCPSHGEGRTGASSGIREFGRDGYFDDGHSLGAGVTIVYKTPICLDRHIMGANFLGLPLGGGNQQVVVMATTISSHNGTEV